MAQLRELIHLRTTLPHPLCSLLSCLPHPLGLAFQPGCIPDRTDMQWHKHQGLYEEGGVMGIYGFRVSVW